MRAKTLHWTLKVKYFKTKVWKMCYKADNQLIVFKFFYEKRNKVQGLLLKQLAQVFG